MRHLPTLQLVAIGEGAEVANVDNADFIERV
jgi:hypothetical protein